MEVLGRYTTTVDSCWFCVCEGHQPLKEAEVEWQLAGSPGARDARRRRGRSRPEVPVLPQVELPHRHDYLYRGFLDKALGPLPFDQSPNI